MRPVQSIYPSIHSTRQISPNITVENEKLVQYTHPAVSNGGSPTGTLYGPTGRHRNHLLPV